MVKYHKADGTETLKIAYTYDINDQVTLMEDFIDSAALFSDVFATMGMKIVLSGTDSLGFWLAMDEELYDRAKPIHTTFIPYREYSRLLGIDSIDMAAHYAPESWPLTMKM